MSIGNHITAINRMLWRAATRSILGYRVRARNPSLICDPTVIWDYGFSDLEHIQLGHEVSIGPFSEIVMYRRSPFSSILGSLHLDDGAVIGSGSNVRAAGGSIRIGAGSAVAQNCTIVAANHKILPDLPRLRTPWDETRTGVNIGRNVWIGAGCVVLPGTTIGDNSVIAAGSVVRGTIPGDELWGGVPARKIRDLPTAPDA